MKKFKLLIALLMLIVMFGFDTSFFSIDDLTENYQKIYVTDEIKPCSYSSIKTYMDYRAITNTGSVQYRYISNYMEVDESGLLIDDEGFIGVALGSYFGPIGSRYYFTLSSGVVLPLVKVEAKADRHTIGGCQARDGSIIEFVIDSDVAMNYFGSTGNGYVLGGNFNNYYAFNGYVEKIEVVTEERKQSSVKYVLPEQKQFDNQNIFNETSGF